MNLGLTDRVCLATGSTSGIGLETVRILAAEGVGVVVTGRSEEGVAEAVEDAGAALGIACDLSRPEEPARVVAEVAVKLGAVECLVNNLGSARQVEFGDLRRKTGRRSAAECHELRPLDPRRRAGYARTGSGRIGLHLPPRFAMRTETVSSTATSSPTM